MPLDGISAHFLARELNDQLTGSRVDRIWQPSRLEIEFLIRSSGRSLRLILSADPVLPRIQLDPDISRTPRSDEPSAFCMLLRKHLSGARLTQIDCPDYERLFYIHFYNTDEVGDPQTKTLVIELMGRSNNIILLNRDGRIHDALIHLEATPNRQREVYPARLYERPLLPDKLMPEDLLKRLSQSGISGADTERCRAGELALTLCQGFSPALARHAALAAGVPVAEPVAELTPASRTKLTAVLLDLLTNITEGRYSPSILFDGAESQPIDFHAYPILGYARHHQTDTLLAAASIVYEAAVAREQLRRERQSLIRKAQNYLRRLTRKISIHEHDVREAAEAEKLQHTADLILSHAHLWQPGMAALTVMDYADPDGKTVIIPLTRGNSPAREAQEYYRQASKTRTRAVRSRQLLADEMRQKAWLDSLLTAAYTAEDPLDFEALREELMRLEPVVREASQAAPERDPRDVGRPASKARRDQRARQDRGSRSKKRSAGHRKDPAPLPIRRYLSADGLAIWAGRNNIQNDELTFRLAAKNDLWLHVRQMPGTHVIVRSAGQPVPPTTLLEAAQTAAWFSRASAQPGLSDSKIAVDYCPVSHVRKPSGAKPGMVIYEGYQTILVQPKPPPVTVQSSSAAATPQET